MKIIVCHEVLVSMAVWQVVVPDGAHREGVWLAANVSLRLLLPVCPAVHGKATSNGIHRSIELEKILKGSSEVWRFYALVGG